MAHATKIPMDAIQNALSQLCINLNSLYALYGYFIIMQISSIYWVLMYLRFASDRDFHMIFQLNCNASSETNYLASAGVLDSFERRFSLSSGRALRGTSSIPECAIAASSLTTDDLAPLDAT